MSKLPGRLRNLDRLRAVKILSLGGSVGFSAALFIVVFMVLPIENTSLGLDWQTIWNGLYGGQVIFGASANNIGGMYTPPWGIPLLLPLGFLPFRISWGVLSFVSSAILVVSVPRADNEKPDLLAIVLLLLSFPALRNVADGNLEGLVIGGIVVMIAGYNQLDSVLFSIGLILASVKLQETWLLCLILLCLVHKNWPGVRRLQTLTITGLWLIFSMLIWGSAWLNTLLISPTNQIGLSSAMGRGSLIDITLTAAFDRAGISSGIIMLTWTSICGLTLLFIRRSNIMQVPRLYVTFLVSASMLLAPYVSGNSFLTVVAIGIIPLFQRHRWLGLVLLGLSSLPFLASHDVLYYYQAYYWTLLLLAVWSTTGYLMWAQTRIPVDE